VWRADPNKSTTVEPVAPPVYEAPALVVPDSKLARAAATLVHSASPDNLYKNAAVQTMTSLLRRNHLRSSSTPLPT
jgi:hypothetical protein